MLIDDLPEDVRRSFLAAYTLDGHEAWELAFGWQKAEAAAQEVPVPEAFLDAVRLRSAMRSVYSADTVSECESDKAGYDALATELNEKYGDIVVLSSESSDLGLRGRRRPAYSTVTDTVRDADGRETVTVTDHAAEVWREDEAIRSRAKAAEQPGELD